MKSLIIIIAVRVTDVLQFYKKPVPFFPQQVVDDHPLLVELLFHQIFPQFTHRRDFNNVDQLHLRAAVLLVNLIDDSLENGLWCGRSCYVVVADVNEIFELDKRSVGRPLLS